MGGLLVSLIISNFIPNDAYASMEEMWIPYNLAVLLAVLTTSIRCRVIDLIQPVGLGSIDTSEVGALCGLMGDGVLKEMNCHKWLSVWIGLLVSQTRE